MELLIYMGLLSIFLVVLTQIFVSILEIKAESESVSAAEQDSRFIVNRLQYDIARAQAITTPASLGGTSSSLAVTIDGLVYTYAIVGTTMVLTNNLGTNVLNSSETTVSQVTFQKIGNSGGKETIAVQLTLTSRTQRNGDETKTVQTTIGRR